MAYSNFCQEIPTDGVDIRAARGLWRRIDATTWDGSLKTKKTSCCCLAAAEMIGVVVFSQRRCRLISVGAAATLTNDFRDF